MKEYQTRLAAILFSLASLFLLGAATYWSWSGPNECAARTELITANISIIVSPKPDSVAIGMSLYDVDQLNNIELSLGDHPLHVSKEGYEDFKDTIKVIDGHNEPVILTLTEKVVPEPEPEPARLKVKTNPPGASVYFQDSYKGLTPFDEKVENGSYPLRIRCESLKAEWEEKISVGPGKEKEVTVDFTKEITVKIRAADQNGVRIPAFIYVDDVQVMVYGQPVQTPEDLHLRVGLHTIRVDLSGYSMVDSPWRMNFARDREKTFRLKKIP